MIDRCYSEVFLSKFDGQLRITLQNEKKAACWLKIHRFFKKQVQVYNQPPYF